MVALDLERFAAVVDDIYAAAEEPERWKGMLARIAAAFRCRAAVLFVQELGSAARPFLVASNGGGTPGELPREDDETFEADYFVSRIAVTGESLGVLLALRREPSERDEPVPRGLSLLLPHVARAIGFQRRLSFARGAFADAMESLDRASIGMMLLDRTSRVLEMNERARLACSEPSPLRLRDGRLGCVTWQEAEIRETIAAMAEGSNGKNGAARGGEIFRIGQVDTGSPLLVAVLPGRDESTGSAIVLTMRAEPVPAGRAEQLRVLYGLSSAESRVAILLCEGRSVEDIAAVTGTTRGTVRTHVKRILAKTRTARQTELVALLLRQAAPADLSGDGRG